MRSLRPEHLAVAIDARAEDLPFADGSFGASMTTFSVHQWVDLSTGLGELRRVTAGPVVILTCDPRALDRFWLTQFAPEVIETERRRYPGLAEIAGGLGGRVEVRQVPIPFDCTDGFGEAYYGRPERLLDPGARLANSAWSFVGSEVHRRFERELGERLVSGNWDERYGELRRLPEFDGSLRLVISTPYAPGETHRRDEA